MASVSSSTKVRGFVAHRKMPGLGKGGGINIAKSVSRKKQLAMRSKKDRTSSLALQLPGKELAKSLY
jgi:hypothetical protein